MTKLKEIIIDLALILLIFAIWAGAMFFYGWLFY